jgi:ABC-type multidrug transport system ATPase subunit
MDREPKLRLFLYSPAQQAIELAARAFPIVRPKPKFTDDRPLMIPIPPAVQPAAQAQAAPLASVGVGIAGLAAAVWAGLRRRGGGRRGAARPAGQACEVGAMAAAPAVAAAASEPVVTVRGLTKKFGRLVAVDVLDLDVRPGEAVALWGVNGAGKTTIIKCLLGLLPFRGRVALCGHDLRTAGKAARRSTGYVSQELAFYDDLTALETLRFFARLRRASLARADVVLAQVGLSEHASKTVRAMSGGMKQRLALAVALLSDPPVLVLDEATANLDTAARRVFLQLLCDLRAAGKSIVFSTHRAEEVLQLADRVVVLDRGRVVAGGRPEELEQVAGLNPWLRLTVAAGQCERAEAALRTAGYAVQRENAALRIRVAAQRKAAPLTALYAAGVTVENFELESEAGDVG